VEWIDNFQHFSMKTIQNHPDLKFKAKSHLPGAAFQALLHVADTEWEGILRLGRYCGISLMSCVLLRWQNVSEDNTSLRLFAGDGTQILEMPLGPKLANYLTVHRKRGCPDMPLFPENCHKGLESLAEHFALLAKKAWGPSGPRKPCFTLVHFSFRPVKAG
jgi:hypothetical protein